MLLVVTFPFLERWRLSFPSLVFLIECFFPDGFVRSVDTEVAVG